MQATNSWDWQEFVATAHHEAGHAVAAYHYARRIRLVEVNVRGVGFTRCKSINPDARDKFTGRQWRQHVREEIVICLAGPVAEEIAYGKDAKAAAVDLQHANQWMEELTIQHDIALGTFTTRTMELLTEPCTWNALRKIAVRLIQGRKLSGDEVEAICASCRVPRVRLARQ